jgi:hypothetical protein
MKKRTKPTKLKVGDKVWIEDGEDSGEYAITAINLEEDDCWLYGEGIGEEDQDIEQQFPLSWIERMYEDQNG